MMRRKPGLMVSIVALFLLVGCARETAQDKTQIQAVPNKWEPDIEKFEAQDRQVPPPAQPILFVGSSTIRIWKVKDAFPGLPVLNRGFGGSQIEDVDVFFDRIVARYQPSTIVFYSGDNDLAAKKSPAQVTQDFRQFLDLVNQKTPSAELIVIAIKPSIARWKLIDEGRETNAQMQKMVEARPNSVFVNIESQILGENGKPREELFRADGLHLSDKGYAILNDAVRPYLMK